MAEQEKLFTIPLRRHFRIYPRWRRTKVAVRATREFLEKHLKTEQVSIGKYLNLKLHEHGRKDPPHHVQVRVWKENEKYIAEIIDAPKEKEMQSTKGKTPDIKAIKEQASTIETQKEKKETLEHPQEKAEGKDEHHSHKGTEGIKKQKHELKRGEAEHHKEVFPKSQKPSHEKRLSKE